MRVDAAELRKHVHAPPPPIPPIEPLLSAGEEAKLIEDGEDPTSVARRRRVVALLRRTAIPTGADAELITLLAAARALPLDSDADRLRAHQRLVEIGRSKNPPAEVRRICEAKCLTIGDAEAFVDALLPPKRAPSTFYESGAGMVGGT